MVLGLLKLALFITLKNSPRNSNWNLSVILKRLASVKSRLKIPGPVASPDPASPNVNAAGKANAFGLNQLSVAGSKPLWSLILGLPMRSTPWVPMEKQLHVLEFGKKLSGAPAWRVRMLPTVHPPRIGDSGPELKRLLPAPQGN